MQAGLLTTNSLTLYRAGMFMFCAISVPAAAARTLVHGDGVFCLYGAKKFYPGTIDNVSPDSPESGPPVFFIDFPDEEEIKTITFKPWTWCKRDLETLVLTLTALRNPTQDSQIRCVCVMNVQL